MLAALHYNITLGAPLKSYTVRQWSRASKSYYLSERKVTDKVSFKKEMLEQIENNIMEKVTLEMDLSPYIRDAVPQTFHGQPMPTKESLLGKRRSRM